MEQIYSFWQDYGLFVLTVILLAETVLFIVQIGKVNNMRKQMNAVIQKAENYLKFILEDEEKEDEKKRLAEKEQIVMRKRQKESAQNKVIQDVLQEIFP